jgi:hypothetical protein
MALQPCPFPSCSRFALPGLFLGLVESVCAFFLVLLLGTMCARQQLPSVSCHRANSVFVPVGGVAICHNHPMVLLQEAFLHLLCNNHASGCSLALSQAPTKQPGQGILHLCV